MTDRLRMGGVFAARRFIAPPLVSKVSLRFGHARGKESGKLLGLAPNYDNNMAFISRGYPAKPNANDLLISLFRDVMDAYPEHKEYIPTVTEEIIDTVIKKINMKVKATEIKEYVLARYNLILN